MRRQCCCATCQSHRTLKLDVFETRYRLCSRWRQFNKPKARLLDDEELPLKSVMSHPKTKRRYQSISSHPLEEKRPRSFSPSTTNVDTTHGMTSRKIDAAGMGTRKSAVTAHIVAGGTTATRTEWPPSHQAHVCSAGQSAAQPCPVRSDPRPASRNTRVKPPELWLSDFRLACQLGGARGDDRAIIRQLPLFLSDTARRWLEELPANQSHDWVDLVRFFKGNFKGTYIRPGNSWDLSKCKQKSGETLREYA